MAISSSKVTPSSSSSEGSSSKKSVSWGSIQYHVISPALSKLRLGRKPRVGEVSSAASDASNPSLSARKRVVNDSDTSPGSTPSPDPENSGSRPQLQQKAASLPRYRIPNHPSAPPSSTPPPISETLRYRALDNGPTSLTDLIERRNRAGRRAFRREMVPPIIPPAPVIISNQIAGYSSETLVRPTIPILDYAHVQAHSVLQSFPERPPLEWDMAFHPRTGLVYEHTINECRRMLLEPATVPPLDEIIIVCGLLNIWSPLQIVAPNAKGVRVIDVLSAISQYLHTELTINEIELLRSNDKIFHSTFLAFRERCEVYGEFGYRESVRQQNLVRLDCMVFAHRQWRGLTCSKADPRLWVLQFGRSH